MMSVKLYRSSRRAADLHINVYRDLFGIVIPLIPLYVLLLPSNENDHPIAITRNRCRHCCSYKLRMYTRICDYDYAIPVHFHHDRLSSCTFYQPGPAIHTANSLRRFFFFSKAIILLLNDFASVYYTRIVVMGDRTCAVCVHVSLASIAIYIYV